jgi:putative Holliday junction resolvase
MKQPSTTQEAPPLADSSVRGRVLAIDLGAKRLGLAMSDPLRIAAQGLPTAERRNRREDLNFLKSLAKRHEVSLIVVGHPVNMDGSEGAQALAAREVAERLRRHLGDWVGEVRLWDERLTTVEANRVLREAGLSTAERAKAVDEVSAVLLLESFLDAERDRASRTEEPGTAVPSDTA